MTIPALSIITPTFNSSKTIRQTIESVLSQNIPDLEYLIMDGGSTDGTLDIIEEFGNQIRVISEPDNGIYDAMNKGIHNTSASLIGIINSDDWYLTNTFNEVLRIFKAYKPDVIYGDTKVGQLDGQYELVSHNHAQLKQRMIGHPAVFVSRTAYEKLGGFNMKYKIAADYDLLLRAYTIGLQFVKIPRALAQYSPGGFSDNPRNRIGSLAENELIHIANGYTTPLQSTQIFLSSSIKTIIHRDSKLQMASEFAQRMRILWDFWFIRSVNE